MSTVPAGTAALQVVGLEGRFQVMLVDAGTTALAMLALTVLFAWTNGVNDGGTLLAASLRSSGVAPATGAATLLVAIVTVPTLIGWRVASTLAERLVSAPGDLGVQLAAVAVVGTVTVVTILSSSGAPTSLTLALIGAISGAGLGAGLGMDAGMFAAVIAAAALAPLAGMLLASAISRPLHRAGGAPTVREWARTGSRSAFVLQAVAYAANDGQKLFVVPILAGIATPLLPAAPRVTAGLIVAVPFAAGAIFGVRRFATTIGSLVRQAPDVTLVSSSASAAMVLGTAALGFPVSMTQTTAGAQVGASIATGVRRIRWDIALRLLQAWVLTLPAAFAVGMALGRAVIR